MKLPIVLIIALLLSQLAAAHADGVSGPDRNTLIKQDWGTIYHLPFNMNTHMEQDLLGEYTIKNGRGAITSIKQEGYNQGYVVFYPDKSSLTVRRLENSEVEINLRGTRVLYRLTNDGWVIHMPDDEIRLSKKGTTLRLRGKRGTTTVVDDNNGFTMTSAAGETRYGRESFDEPFKLTGVPVASHPYVVHGIWFESYGVGAFLDFHLADCSRAFSLLGWYPMMQISKD